MKNNKLQGVGLDLRNVTGLLPEISIDYPNDDVDHSSEINPFYIEYVMIDLLHPYPHIFNEVAQNVITNGGTLIVYVDLSKFDSTIDPWTQSYELWKQLRSGYWKVPSSSITVLFENLPEFSDKFLGNKLWKEDIDGKYLGIVFSNIDSWKEEEKKWRQWFEGTPEVIARPINPLFFNYDLEEWCKLGNAVSIGLDWNGGRPEELNLGKIFGDPFLLGFASYHSQVVLHPLYDDFKYKDKQKILYLRENILREISEEESKKFELTKNSYKPSKISKKLIYESFRINIGEKVTWTLPINEYSEIFYPPEDTVLSFKSHKIDLPPIPGREDFEISDLEYRMKQELDNLLTPLPTSPHVAWKTILLGATDFLTEEFKEEEGWGLEFCALGLNSIAINALHIKKKNWITKHFPDEIDKQKSFLLVMNSPESIYFLDIDSIETLQKKKEKQR